MIKKNIGRVPDKNLAPASPPLQGVGVSEKCIVVNAKSIEGGLSM